MEKTSDYIVKVDLRKAFAQRKRTIAQAILLTCLALMMGVAGCVAVSTYANAKAVDWFPACMTDEAPDAEQAMQAGNQSTALAFA